MKNMRDEKQRKIEKQADSIIRTICKKMRDKYPGMAHVLHYLSFEPVNADIFIETDGMRIFYSPRRIVEKYRAHTPGEIAYRIMHIVAHGLLGHFELAGDYRGDRILHALLDEEVYEFTDKLELRKPKYMQENEEMYFRSLHIERYRKDASSPSLLGVKKYVDASFQRKQTVYRSREIFRQDDHRLWYMQRNGQVVIRMPNGDDPEAARRKLWKTIRVMAFGAQGKMRDMDQMVCCVVTGVDEKSSQYGQNIGDGDDLYRAAGRACMDYGTYLKRFFRNKEREQEDAESIDKALYAWGHEMYGNVAFIEPELERQVKSQMDTVILAIDTSGSCAGATMERFLAETRALFQSLSKCECHRLIMLQCDAAIQKEECYDSIRAFPKDAQFQSGMQMYGFGGTSFLPVFDYADRLVEGGEKIGCLIYLSDGYGDFPTEKPQGYETFFVLDRGQQDGHGIPEWVTKLYLKD